MPKEYIDNTKEESRLTPGGIDAFRRAGSVCLACGSNTELIHKSDKDIYLQCIRIGCRATRLV
jgi:hypothetical protein